MRRQMDGSKLRLNEQMGRVENSGSSWDYRSCVPTPDFQGSSFLPFLTKGLASRGGGDGVSLCGPLPNPSRISPPASDAPLRMLAGSPSPPGRSPSASGSSTPAAVHPPTRWRLRGCSAARSPPPLRRLPTVTTPWLRSLLPPPARASTTGARRCRLYPLANGLPQGGTRPRPRPPRCGAQALEGGVGRGAEGRERGGGQRAGRKGGDPGAEGAASVPAAARRPAAHTALQAGALRTPRRALRPVPIFLEISASASQDVRKVSELLRKLETKSDDLI